MKKILKILGILILIIILFGAGWLIYFNSKYPVYASAPDIKIESTPERLARGEYLATHVSGCVDCHSKRDFTKYTGPMVEGTHGMGGMEFNKTLAGIPGAIYAKNITPSGIGNYSDGELLRVLCTGINKKGEALFPLMPYFHFRELSKEDLYSIITYIRTLKPIENTVPERHLDFPLNLIVKTIPPPMPENFPSTPDKNDSVAYGKYMVNAASCIECHSQMEKGQLLPGLEFAGGRSFCLPDGNCVTSANITPDNETGIGLLTKEAFIQKFAFYRQPSSKNIPLVNGQNTAMPWTEFCNMTDEDLGAIYVYLRTLKPVKNKVEKFSKM